MVDSEDLFHICMTQHVSREKKCQKTLFFVTRIDDAWVLNRQFMYSDSVLCKIFNYVTLITAIVLFLAQICVTRSFSLSYYTIIVHILLHTGPRETLWDHQSF